MSYDCAWCGAKDAKDWMVDAGLVKPEKAICVDCRGGVSDRISEAVLQRIINYLRTRGERDGGETGES